MRHRPPSVPHVPYTAGSRDAKRHALQQQQQQRRRGNTCFGDVSGPELSLFSLGAKSTFRNRGGNASHFAGRHGRRRGGRVFNHL